MKKIACLVLMVSFSIVGICQQTVSRQDGPLKAKNIVLLIGDGMGTTQVYAGIVASKNELNISEFKEIGFSQTYSSDDFITDSGAAGTAIATGFKTYDNAIGVDADTIPRTSILEYAIRHEKATGLIATSEITHATPASFIAHQPSRYMYEEIATDILNSGVDLFIGGGLNYFSKRKDGMDYTALLSNKGYQLVYNQRELSNIKSGKVAGLLYDEAPPKVSDGRDDMLLNSVSKALDILQQEENGFFLMIEGSQIDWGGHDNDTEYLVDELLDFDKAVGKVLEFAKKDRQTLVIVTADHETGGMTLMGGDMNTGKLEAEYTTTHHSGVMVPVFAYGPGAELFKGIYENTDIFHKMMMIYGFKEISKVKVK